MKSTIKTIAIALTLVVGVACNSNKAEGSETTTQESAETEAVATQEAPAPKGDVVVELTDNNMPVAVSLPAVVDCWASWCGPCMRFKPTYHEVAKEYTAKADFFAANVDDNQNAAELLSKLGISNIPTVVILYPDGKTASKTGLMTPDEFRQWLNENL